VAYSSVTICSLCFQDLKYGQSYEPVRDALPDKEPWTLGKHHTSLQAWEKHPAPVERNCLNSLA
jgi:hypothetical protein